MCYNKLRNFAILWLVLLMPGCMEWDYGNVMEDFISADNGLFICNEGNYQYGNATLSYYNPQDDVVEQEVFFRANGMKLGDVAQSMTCHSGLGWIVVNKSHVVFAINLDTFREVGRIENLTSPRYIHFINDTKAYITQLWDNRIAIVDTDTYSISGYITVPGMTMESGSTEQMVQIGQYVYCTCWSYQNSILKIDTRTDEIVATLEVGLQPRSLVADCFARLWVITDGGYDGSPQGHEAATLCRIDPDEFIVEKQFKFRFGDSPLGLTVGEDGNKLFWINKDVWSMRVDDSRLPVRPLIKHHDTMFYGLTVSPHNGDIYVADAIDYQQPGVVYRYSADGTLICSFQVGVNPGAFCWKGVER